jgi:hypothetical protein
MSIDIEFLRYPIGNFQMPKSHSAETLRDAVETIKAFPAHIFSAVSRLTVDQLDTPYRPGGWTVRQLVHHCADSHMNAFIRFKLALTEDNPTIKPYDEASWAELADAKIPIESALAILKGIHLKWGILMDSMTAEDFNKTYFHPEKAQSQPLEEIAFLYAWHCQHHLAHIQHLILRENW